MRHGTAQYFLQQIAARIDIDAGRQPTGYEGFQNLRKEIQVRGEEIRLSIRAMGMVAREECTWDFNRPFVQRDLDGNSVWLRADGDVMINTQADRY